MKLEMALALVLLSGAGILLKSLLAMRGTAPGFRSDRLLAVDFSLPRIKFAETPERLRFFASVLDRVRGIPGVRSAALVADLPLGGGEDGLAFHIVGRPDPSPNTGFQASFNIASAGYFQTMGIPLRLGRTIQLQDTEKDSKVAVVNEALVRRYYHDQNPVSRHLRGEGKDAEETQIIAVVGDAKYDDLRRQSRPAIYAPYFLNNMNPGTVHFELRTAGDPNALIPTVRRIVEQMDSDLPLLDVKTQTGQIDEMLVQERMFAKLTSAFVLGKTARMSPFWSAISGRPISTNPTSCAPASRHS